MFRIAAFVLTFAVTNAVYADKAVTLSFGEQSVRADAQLIRYNMYYVLVSKDGSFEQGKLLQVNQLKADPSRYSVGTGAFSWPNKVESMTIRWDEGSVEKAHVTPLDTETGRLRYSIYDHTDKKQIGDRYEATLSRFKSLPAVLQAAVTDNLDGGASAAERDRARAQQADREQLAAQLQLEMQMDRLKFYDSMNRMYSEAFGFPTID